MPTSSTDRASGIIDNVVDQLVAEGTPVLDGDALEMMVWLEGMMIASIIGPDRISADELVRASPVAVDGADGPMLDALCAVYDMRLGQLRLLINEQRDGFEPPFLDFANDADRLALAREWATGFIQGTRLRPGSWDALVQSRTIALLLPFILILSTDDDPGIGAGKTAEELHAMRMDAVAQLGAAVWNLRQYWQSRRSVPARRSELAKLGRNTPCPCGSGKKFKRCCMN